MKTLLRYLSFGYADVRVPVMAACLTLAGALFLAFHLTNLPRSLGDLDSLNFAFGVRHFDVSVHQPHPPGYPVFIALARISTAALRTLGVTEPEARGLAILGVLAGTLAVVPLFVLFRGIDRRETPALVAALASVAAPLFWFSANRPLTDVIGLTAALCVQALGVVAWRWQRDASVPDARVRRALYVSAAAAGLAIGLRSQTFLLTLPLGVWLILAPGVPAARRRPVTVLAIFIAGVLAWGIPLLAASGGLTGYLHALSDQASADFSGVTMLWTQPSLRLLAVSLHDTLIRPWVLAPFGLTMVVLASAGLVVLGRRSLVSAVMVAVLTIPYTIFHLLFQETATIRYALPLVPAVVFLSVITLDAGAGFVARRVRLSREAALGAAGAVLIAVSLSVAVPALRSYARSPSPVFRAIEAMKARAASLPGGPPALVMHAAARRAVAWEQVTPTLNVLPVEVSYEWMAAVRYWLGGGRAPVWFLARPIRTDLALFDPRHVQLMARYGWSSDAAALAGGSRPSGADWYAIERPAWFLGKGWALTPEIAGVSARGRDGPGANGSTAYIARTSAESTMMIGGRQVGEPGSAAHIRVELDGRTVLEWTQDPGFFLKLHTLSAGELEGAGDFGRMVVTSNPARDLAAPVALEQFDLAASTRPVLGYGDGWMEPEFDPAKRRLWRWSGRRSVLRLPPRGRTITLDLEGESPVDQIGKTPLVTVRVGDKVIDSFRPSGGFARVITVPDDALRKSGGRVILEADGSFVPNQRSGNGDRRELALRIFKAAVR